MLAGDFADPFVMRERDEYYAFATGAGASRVQVAKSRDLGTWARLGDALPNLPAWASQDRGLTWAPSVLARHHHYVLYYTTRDAASQFQCISRAVSARPEGPYVDDSSRPFVCQVDGDSPFCGSIDPSPFVDGDGTPFLLWKSDENSSACQTSPRIWAQQLTNDGTDLVGRATPLLAMDQSWEGPIIEAPSMIHHQGRYLLFYSANFYESAQYAIGFATCGGPLGACSKATTTAPLLRSEGPVLGPGGQELFADVGGAVWMAYHAWTAPRTSYAGGGVRSFRLARLTFAPADGAHPPSAR